MLTIAYDFSDLVPLTVQVTDPTTGTLANSSAVVLTVILPDGTFTTPSVSNPSVGQYQIDYAPTMVGLHKVRWVATGLNTSGYSDVFDVRDPSPPYLVSLADAKQYLNILTADNDEELRNFIEAATSIVEDVVGPVVVRTVTEVHPRPSNVLVLRCPPVVSLLSLTPLVANGFGVDVTALDLDPETGIVRRVDGLSIGRQHAGFQPTPVRAVYTAGRPAVPAAITMAARVVIDHMWETQRGHTQGVRPAPGGGRGTKKGPVPTLPPRAQEYLRPYRRAPAIF